ncbi:MAG: uroporphyrinogen decarboxylase [Deltaproteobacteria bacterium]|nr:uroporphyrinogen decarboxylase [Candidatus Anaeroferrophillus wilburensis]MBN2888210.1 uroporphyrinogen decarboxylase [Deltaproteobacteria bacterium]
MENSRFLQACRRQAVDCTPVWMMRQAGRYLPEYRALREKYSFWQMCKQPELAVEVTLQPLRRMELDAAILFSDILVPLEGMGAGFEFIESRGPVLDHPIRTAADVDRLTVIDAREVVPFVMEAIGMLRRELTGKVPLIGFSGAPFTLASYLVEGGGSKQYQHIKTMMYAEPELFHRLMDKITAVVISYLSAQIEAGAQVIQLFDSWVGCLNPADYREYVFPYSQKIFQALAPYNVPMIHFANQAATFLDLVRDAGGDILGIDWRIDLATAWKIIGEDRGIQGNIDPITLFAPIGEIRKRVKGILDQAAGRPGHIFNLGHGILPTTPIDHAKAMIDAVHEFSAR